MKPLIICTAILARLFLARRRGEGMHQSTLVAASRAIWRGTAKVGAVAGCIIGVTRRISRTQTDPNRRRRFHASGQSYLGLCGVPPILWPPRGP